MADMINKEQIKVYDKRGIKVFRITKSNLLILYHIHIDNELIILTEKQFIKFTEALVEYRETLK